MGLKITGIRIENFRKFREPFELNLVGPAGAPLDYVVLAGPNGCGKTTVLEAILIALRHEGMIDRSTAAGAEPTGGARIVLRLQETWSGGTQTWLMEWTPTGHVLRKPIGPNTFAVTSDGYLDESSVAALPVEYISSRRLPALVGPIQEVTRGRPPDSTEANRIWLLKNRILQQQGRRANPRYSGPEPLDKEWLTRLNQFWQVFRPDGTYFALDVVDATALDVTEWDLFLFGPSGRVCAIDQLSSGEIEVVAMAAPFITRPTEFDGLLLIDEPELHLHPEWQFSIAKALRKLIPGAQIVMATHADDPWDDAFSFQRFLLVPPTDPRSAEWREKHSPGAEE